MALKLASKFWSWLKSDSGNGGENALLKSVLENAEKGNAESVLTAINNYAENIVLRKHLDEQPGLAALDKVEEPIAALEIGTYCAYSAIRIASKFKSSDSKLISLEKDTFYYGVAQKLIEHAGMSSKVKLCKGRLSEVAEEIAEYLNQMKAPDFNFIFMNHSKKCYLPDFMFLKERRWLGKEAVIVANSKGFLHDHEYLKYLNDHPEELDTKTHGSTMTVATYK